LIFHLVPHTHWDREWYLTRAGFQARLVPVMDALLEQLEQDASARFVLDGQTILLEDYLAARPENARRIAAQVRRGALEIGPWFVLADLLIPAGESLIRNLLEGARNALRLGGRMDVLYSPDAFGHPAALPAIANEFGLRCAVVRRGLGRPLGVDRDFYRWTRGTGEGLLVYHLPRSGYDAAIEVTRPGADLPRAWAPVRAELVSRSSSEHVVVFIGADHHPLVRGLSSFRSRLAALEEGHQVWVYGLSDLLRAAGRSLAGVPEIRGELRRIDGHTWVLQDVHSTRARLKRRHGRAELGLTRIAEPLAALAAWSGGSDPRGLLRLAWRALIESQFHDTLCGSCTDGVAREQDVRLETVETLGRAVATAGLHQLAGHDPDRAREEPGKAAPGLVLWNPAPRERSAIVTAELTFFRSDLIVGPPDGRTPRIGPGFRPFRLDAGVGEPLPVQVLSRRTGTERLDAQSYYPDQDHVDRVCVAFEAPPVPGLGLRGLVPRVGPAPPRGAGLEVREDRLANRHVAVSISPTGTFTLEDRVTGERYDELGLLLDEPDVGDTYTFSRGGAAAVRSGGPRSRAVLAGGPLVGAVETAWTMPSAGSGELGVRLITVLHADSPVVRLRVDVDNRAIDHRLRMRFPVGAGGTCVAGAAFGVEQRAPVTPDQAPGRIEYPVLTAPAQRFAAAARGSRGLAVLSPVFFEYEWTADGALLVTLLRAVGELSRGELPERPGHAGWPEPVPLAQEQGIHPVELALAPASAEDLAHPDRLERVWEDVCLPIQASFVRDFSGSPYTLGDTLGISLEGDGLVCSAVKPAEAGDDLVLRCWNVRAEETVGHWRFARPVARARLARADETGARDLPLAPDGRSVEFPAGPHAIVTLIVSRKRA
jgi:mannosylglycerate hydrolase